jgi:adenylate cyclase
MYWIRKRIVILSTTEGITAPNKPFMPKEKKGTLRRIANIIMQNSLLAAENKTLYRQNERLSHEVDKYKEVVAKTGYVIPSDKLLPDKKLSQVRYRTATVLYADVMATDHFMPQLDAKHVVDSLDEIFINLQQISAKYAIRNIRTIGDSLMYVGGIPVKNITNPIEVLKAAVEMQYYFKVMQQTSETGKIWKLRIGIHTGTVIANASGRKKPQYEIKGETVNLATRILQFCEDGNIIISATTYELVKDLFLCDYYNRMPVKYEGEIPLYIVKSIKPEFSLQGKGIIPNKRFSICHGLIQFTNLQEIILDKLEKHLSQNLYYHNVKHTMDVVTQVELIGLGEGVTDEELLLLKTAALFHDTGHAFSYEDHEIHSCQVARELLPEYYYTISQIDTICELIMATKLPPKPRNKLEEIMCDADLDYLGRSDMIPVSNTLFLELKERSMISSLKDWNEMQMKFISRHQYFTLTARNLREVNKQAQIERIKNSIVEE